MLAKWQPLAQTVTLSTPLTLELEVAGYKLPCLISILMMSNVELSGAFAATESGVKPTSPNMSSFSDSDNLTFSRQLWLKIAKLKKYDVIWIFITFYIYGYISINTSLTLVLTLTLEIKNFW